MREWRVDCASAGSVVTDGEVAFNAVSDGDAAWLCAVLNREAESVALSAAYARMDPSERVAVSHGGAPSL